ncbi:acyl-CoA/acyl-ACP dehydrogenase [Bacillus cereus]|uniref:acyl-CoA dehydrogenase family protein n=1 Tax=Bacillus cereus TaxID=1396 RepID=UPI000279A9FA|nr:acyl-CoA dehydrogenase family protein [Bacillus cereus]EJR73578.1 hypothetical protein IK9_05113 [Bacillus cereus VD166]MDA1913587.1 acyl-CoA/acyl-ACP dehydrogenase [Bacillus cereus]MDA2659707.1 acyl-CoA/acyl-ACP dehydrogenase [Bacillus cereus]MDZ4631623.1 acyl-CoA/acyl-ACP dehydrogenase [Bacillus cereus]HDR7761762.1 acyl-CoA/acyl-ACP dehydrogenase [Bacillus cereus]
MLDSLRNGLKEYALELRGYALEADKNRDLPKKYLQQSSIFQPLWRLGVPKEYGYGGIKTQDGTHYGSSSIELAVCTEELAYGDPAMMLSMPGPQLLGPILQELGTKEQQDKFFSSFMTAEPIWTAFNLTEPNAGSDIAALETVSVKKDDETYVMNGEKKYIANAERAQWALTFTKMGSKNNQFAIQSFLIHEDQFKGHNTVEREYGRTLGMRVARLGHTIYRGLEVNRSQIIGLTKPPLQRGLRSAMKVFFRMRPSTSSIAVGTCRAILDYVRDNVKVNVRQELILDELQWKVERTRRLIYRAANEVDQNIFNPKTSSMAKWMANSLVYEVSRRVTQLLGPIVITEHPLLEKWMRDGRMIEFMEGSTNIHKREVAQELLGIN